MGHEEMESLSGPGSSGRPIRAALLLVRAMDYEEFMEREKAKNANFEWLAYIEGCSRARISQIMDLLCLHRDLQEEILFMEAEQGRDLVTEGDLRHVVRVQEREEQRRRWDALLLRRRRISLAATTLDLDLPNAPENPAPCFPAEISG